MRDEAVAVAASSQILGRGHRIQAAAKELHAEDAEDQVVDSSILAGLFFLFSHVITS